APSARPPSTSRRWGSPWERRSWPGSSPPFTSPPGRRRWWEGRWCCSESRSRWGRETGHGKRETVASGSAPRFPFPLSRFPGGVSGAEGEMRVEQVRGGVVEAVHDVHAAVVDTRGRLVARTGDPDLVTFWRSAAKPFQAMPLVEDGVTDRFGFTSEELALVCASHSSEPVQVARVRELLGKIGCSERDL